MAWKPRTKPIGIDGTGRPIFAYGLKHGRPVCGHTNRDGTICQSENRFSNGRCRRGGGLSTGPPMKHGMRSQHFPKHLRKTFQQLRNDPTLTHHRDAVAMVETFSAEELQQLSAARAPGTIWNDAIECAQRFLDGDHKAFPELQALLEEGQSYEARKARLLELQEAAGKHKERENRREAFLKLHMTGQQADAFTAAHVAMTVEVCNDETVPREQIPAEIGRRLALKMSGESFTGLD